MMKLFNLKMPESLIDRMKRLALDYDIPAAVLIRHMLEKEVTFLEQRAKKRKPLLEETETQRQQH